MNQTQNTIEIPLRGKYKYVGVGKFTNRKYWCSSIRYKRKLIFLGSYPNMEEAAMAYNIAAKILFENFANLNDIDIPGFNINEKYLKVLNKAKFGNIIISNHLRESIFIPQDHIIRINLAWIFSLNDLEHELDLIKNDILIDFPEKRIKPPNNKYTPQQIIPFIKQYKNIKYIAISNVEEIEEIQKFSDYFNKVQIILKIESYKGYQNLNILLDFVSKFQKPICQIDSEDLQKDIERLNIKEDVWSISRKINIICDGYKNGITLNLGGVVFTTDKKL